METHPGRTRCKAGKLIKVGITVPERHCLKQGLSAISKFICD